MGVFAHIAQVACVPVCRGVGVSALSYLALQNSWRGDSPFVCFIEMFGRYVIPPSPLLAPVELERKNLSK